VALTRRAGPPSSAPPSSAPPVFRTCVRCERAFDPESRPTCRRASDRSPRYDHCSAMLVAIRY
jgi:hypothetical protein